MTLSDKKKCTEIYSKKTGIVRSAFNATRMPVIGIGASAGGLDALKNFFLAMPPTNGMAFIVVQHLDPHHKSNTASILARYTDMKVSEIEDQMPITANHVYVIPPNKELAIKKGILHLSEPSQSQHIHLSIDSFYQSLANDQKDNAACIILSGTGTDGTLGLKAIKGNGGLVMVQTPDSAQFEGMPNSAINTGIVDYLLPVEEMPDTIIKYFQHTHEILGTRAVEAVAPKQLGLILAALQKYTKYDFHGYKKGTLMRRIERRMGLKQFKDIADYVSFIEEDEQEANFLVKDLLISVTAFFREPDAYQLLEKEVIQKLVRDKDTDEPIRVWVPGCATGEEPYSIGILFFEQIQAMKKKCRLQIFATDIDEQALKVARAGKYPLNIEADLSADRLREFFNREGQYYQIVNQLRDSILFAVQDLINDPPFSKLDLICCRNLLIYLEPEMQRKIISKFHYVLNAGGFLFLGSSETIGQQENLFQPISKKNRLYRRTGQTHHDHFDLTFAPSFEKSVKTDRFGIEKRFDEPLNLMKITQQKLLEHYAPFAVLINRNYEILYLYGQSAPYLQLATGKPTQDLLINVREGLRSRLRNAVQKAIQDREEVTIKAQVKRDRRAFYPVQLTVLPVKTSKLVEDLFVITFTEAADSTQLKIEPEMKMEITNETLVSQLELELYEVKDELRSNIEELEAFNEELKTSNEEVLSMNEELQSSNEELETSREELQSLNEELTTVNNQLKDKVEELAAANDDLNNLLNSIEICTLFLDPQLCIKRFTTNCKLFNLIDSDIGRPISDFASRILNFTLVQDAEDALANLTPNKKEICTREGEFFIQHILPFRTAENKIEGVVVTFVEITDLKQAEESLGKEKKRVELLLKSTGESIYGVDAEGKCIFVNDKCLEHLGFTESELIGNHMHQLVHHSHTDGSIFPWEDCFVHRCLQEGVSYRINPDIAWRKNGTSFPASYIVEPVIENEVVTGAVVIFRDMTEEVAITNKLTRLARYDSLTGLVNRREFEERLERVLERVKQDKTMHVVCYLDLDQFKVINDSCGHMAGDELLRQISGILAEHVRRRDTLARLGGDEFGVIMEHCNQREGKRVAQKIRDAVETFRFQWEEKTYVIGISIGLVVIKESVGDLIDVLKAADAACYAAKEGGRNRIHVYNEQDKILSARHGEMQWVMRINQALEKNHLLLVLQPIASIDDRGRNNIFYEVLLRMQEDDKNLIMPGDFLGAAERYKLANKIDQWVIDSIFKWICTIDKNKLEHVSLFNINLSGQSLGDRDFLSFTISKLKNYQIPSKKICFEITESAAITNLANANKFMHALKQLGCLFALDDFGTGLSSFEYLKSLPIDYLKIPGLFVKDILKDTFDLAMVKSINDIGQVMGKKTIAESVETEEILLKLSELGVNYAQGYAIGKPVLLEDVKFIKNEFI